MATKQNLCSLHRKAITTHRTTSLPLPHKSKLHQSSSIQSLTTFPPSHPSLSHRTKHQTHDFTLQTKPPNQFHLQSRQPIASTKVFNLSTQVTPASKPPPSRDPFTAGVDPSRCQSIIHHRANHEPVLKPRTNPSPAAAVPSHRRRSPHARTAQPAEKKENER
ncbi:hypothetical protein M0R45_016104 [Rubus argutus]|uniref:Uncharacterized protein n=1 Tax=Rubus argutus TaxID=59490 RepID=A0AAW1XSG2_RUBAR